MNDAPGAGVAGAGTQALSDRSAHANEIPASALDQRERLPGAVTFSTARIVAPPILSDADGGHRVPRPGYGGRSSVGAGIGRRLRPALLRGVIVVVGFTAVVNVLRPRK